MIRAKKRTHVPTKLSALIQKIFSRGSAQRQAFADIPSEQDKVGSSSSLGTRFAIKMKV
jgi:hypothetical protein